MSFSFTALKRTLTTKYSGKLSSKEVEELLNLDQGFSDDKFPQKRLKIERISFSGIKNVDGRNEAISFDQRLEEGLSMILADNLKGKSSIFKIIKFALTGDNDIEVDVKGWLKQILLEFRINQTHYTAYLNLEKTVAKGSLSLCTLDQFQNPTEENVSVFTADSAVGYKALMQDFFFNEFQFYHLNWTQKNSGKDKNELIESKATWNTYFESIYLTSRASTTLAFGNQEELIFQMLLGLKLTYPINRIKTRLEKTQFDLAKLRDFNSRETKNKVADLSKLEKQYEKSKSDLSNLKTLKKDEVDLSKLYDDRNAITTLIDNANNENAELDIVIINNKRSISQNQNQNHDFTAEAKKYKDLINKASKSKIALEEYVQFGIFFSNLDIKICPHCNTAVSEEKKKHEKDTKECMLCMHTVPESPTASADSFEGKINSLNLEIAGYENQLEVLRAKYAQNKKEIESTKTVVQEKENRVKIIKAENRENYKRLKELDKSIGTAKQQSGAEQRILELEKQNAVLEYRIQELKKDAENTVTGEVQNYENRIELLSETLEILKSVRTTQNEEIINSFKSLLLDELHDLGIVGINEVSLNESYKISYNLNGNWVTFDKISEGQQLRIKIAFYLSIIQLDIRHDAGKHPRLLIIDSPAKEEGDRTYVDGLKRLLVSISEKYKNDLQIVIGTAVRELDGAVPATNTITYPEGAFVF